MIQQSNYFKNHSFWHFNSKTHAILLKILES